jgi:protease-4
VKRFLLGILCGFLLAGLALVIIGFAVARFGSRPPSVADNSTLFLRLTGDLPEIGQAELPFAGLQAPPELTLMETWDVLRKAAVDSRIKAIALEPYGVDAGWAKLSEVRDSIIKFKKSGKPVIAYLRNPSARDYYLATAADKIYISREDILDVKGMRVEMMFFKRGLDKLGVELEIEHAGKYKDAADAFVRTEATDETREVMNAMLDQLYGDLVNTIAAARGKTPEQVRTMIDSGPFLAPDAEKMGLIDGLLYQGEYEEAIQKRIGQDSGKDKLTKLSAKDYAQISADSLGLEGGTRIAVVMAQGEISRGTGQGGLNASADNLQSASFNALLRKVGDDSSVKGVILRIDSPGGDAIASDEMLEEVKRLSKKKPMVISMGDVAASGGYYMAMSGDPVLAYPNTITGSIGVIFGKVNLKGLFDKLGVDVELMKRGKFADVDTSVHALTPEGREKLKLGIDHVYQSFLARVAEGRKRPVAEVAELAQGRVWMGAQAKGNKLVDEMGGYDRAIELVKQRAKIASGDKVRLVVYPEKKTAIQMLFGSTEELLQGGSDTAIQARIERQINAQLRTVMPGANVRTLLPGGMLKILPYGISVH